jgi:hypothetical protein
MVEAYNGTFFGYQWQVKCGRMPVGGSEAIVWNAALLFGLTQASPDTNFHLQAEYES